MGQERLNYPNLNFIENNIWISFVGGNRKRVRGWECRCKIEYGEKR